MTFAHLPATETRTAENVDCTLIVAIVNHKGTPAIIEAQHWDAYNPVEIITDPTRAIRRYGDEDQVHLALTILPPRAGV